MKKIQYAIWKNETNNAGGKAKNDAFDIAESMGFNASYNPSKIRLFRIIQQFLSYRKFDDADIIFMQYPAVDFHLISNFLKHVDPSKKSIALIHDLRSIQGIGIEENIDEISLLNNFEYVISHNKNMATYLNTYGFKGKVITLELFDYLHNIYENIQEPKGDGSIVFAGNLNKSTFINKLSSIDNLKFLLYGNLEKNGSIFGENIEYKGSLSSEEIVYKLEGDYGLVWDGDSINYCSGKNGDYLRFNSPHKASLYISAGKPIITWKHSAIAEFVEKNQIGIVIDSLRDLEMLDLAESYKSMRERVLLLKEKVGRGTYLKTALGRCISDNR